MISNVRPDWDQWVKNVSPSTPWFNEICDLCAQVEKLEHDLKNAQQTIRLIARQLSQAYSTEQESK